MWHPPKSPLALGERSFNPSMPQWKTQPKGRLILSTGIKWVPVLSITASAFQLWWSIRGEPINMEWHDPATAYKNIEQRLHILLASVFLRLLTLLRERWRKDRRRFTSGVDLLLSWSTAHQLFLDFHDVVGNYCRFTPRYENEKMTGGRGSELTQLGRLLKFPVLAVGWVIAAGTLCHIHHVINSIKTLSSSLWQRQHHNTSFKS